MRWKARGISHAWHKWFAWYPVQVGNTFIWLEYVYRKGYQTGYGPAYEYRAELAE